MIRIALFSLIEIGIIVSGSFFLTAQPKSFEVSASTYAWELHNETPQVVLDNLLETAHINSAYLIALMHGSRRPKNIDRYPHDPHFQMWQAEDACVYWHPDTALYGRIKPVLSEHAFLNQTNWLKVFVDESKKRGLKTGAEISHYIIPKKVLMRPENQELCQRDLFGNPIYILCPNHPEGRKYILALFDDLAKNYGLDFIQTCYLPMWDKSGDASGGSSCFCHSCLKKAQSEGIDLKRAVEQLQKDPQNPEAIKIYLHFHRKTLIELLSDITETISRRNAAIEFRYNHHAKDMDWGRIMPDVVPLVGSVRISDYTEQLNSIDSILALKMPWVDQICKLAGNKPVIAAVAVRPGATPQIIRNSVCMLAKSPVKGISLGHYESAPFSYLNAVQDGLADVGIVKGDFRIDPSDFKTSGFVACDYIVERGLKVVGEKAAAQAVFGGSNGVYFINPVVACEKGGIAVVTFSVEGKEAGKISFEGSIDCWQRFSLLPQKIKKGDEIQVSIQSSSTAKPIISSVTFRETK